MDDTDPEITFDESGVCNHCYKFNNVTQKTWHYEQKGEQAIIDLQKYFEKKLKGNKKYDFLLGISGGIDSSFLAVKAKEWGWNVLLLHVDTGWNSELAQNNIQNIVRSTGFDLYTEVIEWETMRNLQLAYIKSGVPNMDVPQDHVFSAVLAQTAQKFGIKYILSGDNISTECTFPRSWHALATDIVNLRYIAKTFGPVNLDNYPTTSILRHYVIMPFFHRVQFVRPLNYIEYNKKNAVSELKNNHGYKSYGYKHGESIFTKYFQNHLLIKKYNMDKRKPHFSSLIQTGQMTRENALKQLKSPAMTAEDASQIGKFIAKKLGLSQENFHSILMCKNSNYRNFPSEYWKFRLLKSLQFLIASITGKFLNPYR